MTNLIEKTLITGFGIFTLILFFIMISPFIQEIEEYKEEKKDNDDELEVYTIFISKIHNAINTFIENPYTNINKEIEYPKSINITFIENYVKFDFIIENEIQYKLLAYNAYFVQKYYFDMPSKTYLLNITQNSVLINVDLINIK